MTSTLTQAHPPIDLQPAELKAQIAQGDAVLIDVREPFEHRAEWVEGAVLMPLDTLDPEAIRQRFPGKQIIFHCAGGKRSAKACAAFAQGQSDPTYHLAGGIEAWKQAGLPTLSPKAGPIPVMRQVQITAGALVVLGLVLGHFVAEPFYLLSVFIGCGLIFAGLSGWCGMAKLLAKMPWNKSA